MTGSDRVNGLVSVCLTVHNRVDLIEACLDSLFAQTYPNIEIIAVDDGSTDGSYEYLREIHDSRLTVIRNQTSKGGLIARRQAFDASVGEFIAIMDDDDICHPQRFEKQIRALNDGGYDICGTGVQMFQDGTDNDRTIVFPEDQSVTVALLCRMCSIWNPTIVFKSEVLLRTGLFYSQTDFPAADWGLWRRLLTVPGVRFFNMQEALLSYRVHESQVTGRTVRSRIMAARQRAAMLETLGAPRYHPGIKVHLRCFDRASRYIPNFDELLRLESLYHRCIDREWCREKNVAPADLEHVFAWCLEEARTGERVVWHAPETWLSLPGGASTAMGSNFRTAC